MVGGMAQTAHAFSPETATELMDDHPKRDTRGRRIAAPARRAEIVAGYAASGLTQKAFARQEGVNYRTLVAWLGQNRRRSDGDANTAITTTATSDALPRFAQVTWPPAAAPSSRIEVILPDGVTLRGNDPCDLLVLVQALAPRHPC